MRSPQQMLVDFATALAEVKAWDGEVKDLLVSAAGLAITGGRAPKGEGQRKSPRLPEAPNGWLRISEAAKLVGVEAHILYANMKPFGLETKQEQLGERQRPMFLLRSDQLEVVKEAVAKARSLFPNQSAKAFTAHLRSTIPARLKSAGFLAIPTTESL